MRRTPAILAAAAAFALAAALAAPARAAETNIVVYVKGKTLRYDQEVGAELKEVFLESYDCATGKLIKKETIEAYFHLSEDKEIITPDAICDRCRTTFTVEKKGEKYYFGGVREKPATLDEANKAAPAPAPGEGLKALEAKVKRISQELVKVGFGGGTGQARARIVTSEFTESLKTFGDPDLDGVAKFVLADDALDPDGKYNVLRTFGFTFYERKDYPKAIFFFDKGIELDARAYSAHFMKGAALEAQGEGRKAVKAYGKALGAVAARQAFARSTDALDRVLTEASGLTAGELASLRPKLDALRKEPPEAPKSHESAHVLAEEIERVVK